MNLEHNFGYFKVSLSKNRKVMCPKRKAIKNGKEKRHTHSTIAGIEDLTAVLVDLTFRVNRLIAFSKTISNELEETTTRLETAMQIIRTMRKSPYSYPTDGYFKIKRTQGTLNATTKNVVQASQD